MFFALERYNASTSIKMSLYIWKKSISRTYMHSQMTELVLCFMDKIIVKKLFVSPKVIISIAQSPKCLSGTKWKQASRNIGHHKTVLSCWAYVFLDRLSRWKDSVVYHGREVLKQLLNSLKPLWNDIFYAMNLKYLQPKFVYLILVPANNWSCCS